MYMGRDYTQVIDLFFDFLFKMKTEILNKRPMALEFLRVNKFDIQRDPFGKYLRMIDFVGEKNQVNMKEFTNRFSLDAGTATGIIDKLVKKKIFIRVSDESDRRKVGLELTKYGTKIYNKQIEIQKGEIKRILDILPDEDIEHVVRILKKIDARQTNSG